MKDSQGETITIALTPDLDDFLTNLMRDTNLGSKSEAVIAALRFIAMQEKEHATKFALLRDDVQKGLRQIAEGQGHELSGEEVVARVKARINRRAS